MPQVSRLGSFSIRSSGRDLSVVRRPVARVVVAPVAVPDVASLKKAELAERPHRDAASDALELHESHAGTF